MNTLEFLIRFEKDCLALYEMLGSQAANRELKDLYELLAGTRKNHLETLEGLKESAHGNDVESELAERATHVIDSWHAALFGGDVAKKLRNDRDAFEHVLHAEDDMIRMCEGMAKAEKNEKTKALLNWFVEDEKRQREEIEGIYEFVEAPHCYLEWGEFSNLRTL